MKKTLDIKKLILLNMPYILLGLFANLKRPVQPRSTDKKPKQHEEVR